MRSSGLVLLLALLGAGPASAEALFEDATERLGVRFTHGVFPSGQKDMPENMGAGLAVFDADGDGRLDLFFVQGAPVRGGAEDPASIAHRFFHQRPDGTFAEASERFGFGSPSADRGVGMGVCFGDADRDGDLDLYVTHYGPDIYYRNDDGRFVDATASVGLGKASWSVGCTFFDADGDGDLELYVASYVDFSAENHKYCGDAKRNLRAYCHPDIYGAVADAYYRNDGGRFVDISEKAGIKPSADGKGLGVAAADFDGDGDQDVLVANDSTMNFFYAGDGAGRFEESALFAGLGLNGAGAAEASMGVAAADLDGDQRLDVLLTHLDLETNTFYRNGGDGLFLDRSDVSGLGAPSLPWVGFGVATLDVELDGDLDVAVVNGHIIDNIERFDAERRHRQPAQLFRYDGKRFREFPDALPLGPLVGRGLVAADLDGDGDEDLVLTQNGGPARVLLNRAGDSGASVTLRLTGRKSASDGFGAYVVAYLGERALRRELPMAGSYLSQGPPEIVIGLGGAARIDSLEVYWPSGQIDRHGPIAAGERMELKEKLARKNGAGDRGPSAP
ncbi:MAG: CRTAC1 family protein [Acidobacteriota bacterium]